MISIYIAAIVAVMMAQNPRTLKPFAWIAEFWMNFAIVPHYIRDVRDIFVTSVANIPRIIHDGTTAEKWGNVK